MGFLSFYLQPCASSVLACLGALCDHTTDERGDVGWKTRAAACEAVPRLLSRFVFLFLCCG